jgi:cell division protein FtsB
MNKALKILRNKYVIAILIFIIWVGFIDRNNLIKTFKIRKELNSLKADKEYYLQEIEETRRIRDELLNNKSSLEKFAREEYYMKKSDEEIFIVEFKD